MKAWIDRDEVLVSGTKLEWLFFLYRAHCVFGGSHAPEALLTELREFVEATKDAKIPAPPKSHDAADIEWLDRLIKNPLKPPSSL
jgi:hypothetical protein